MYTISSSQGGTNIILNNTQEYIYDSSWTSNTMVQIKELTKGLDLKNKYFFIGTFKHGKHIRSNYINAEKLLKSGFDGIDENYDYYISVNTFRFKGKRDIQRSEDYIVSKNFVYIDLDFKTHLHTT